MTTATPSAGLRRLYRPRLVEKLGLTRRVALVRYALDIGILDGEAGLRRGAAPWGVTSELR
jgi:hypothetical protein